MRKLQKTNIAILQGQNLLLHWMLLQLPPHTPKAVFSIENHVVDGWICRGNNQANRASRVSVAVVVVLSKRACGNTQSGRCWLFVILVFNERIPLCLWLLRLRYNIHSLTVWGRAKVTTHFSI